MNGFKILENPAKSKKNFRNETRTEIDKNFIRTAALDYFNWRFQSEDEFYFEDEIYEKVNGQGGGG